MELQEQRQQHDEAAGTERGARGAARKITGDEGGAATAAQPTLVWFLTASAAALIFSASPR